MGDVVQAQFDTTPAATLLDYLLSQQPKRVPSLFILTTRNFHFKRKTAV